MSHFDAGPEVTQTLTASLPVPSYPSFVPASHAVASRAPQALGPAGRSARRPSTHPATTVPSRAPRSRKQRRASVGAEELLSIYTPLVNKIVGGFQRKLPRNVLR